MIRLTLEIEGKNFLDIDAALIDVAQKVLKGDWGGVISTDTCNYVFKIDAEAEPDDEEDESKNTEANASVSL